MNEELRIIIRAVTDEARKNIQSVRKELERMEETSQEASKTVDKAMSLVGKAALTAVGSVVALTTAITALGKRSLEFEKIQGQLVSGFQAVGLSAGQAAKTYDEFFGFLGEMDTAAEASNLLAKLTQEEQHLAEWTQILQGVFATFPDSIPIETLIESINEASKTGELVSAVEDAFNWAGYNSEVMQHQMLQTNSEAEREALLRTTLNSLYGAAGQLYAYNNKHLIAYNKSQAALNRATSEAMRYITPMMTSLNNLAAVILENLKPAFETISAVIIVFTQWIIAAIQGIAMFFGIFSDNKSNSDTMSDAIGSITSGLNGAGNAASDAGNELKDLQDEINAVKRATMGFDELNVVGMQTGFHTKTNLTDSTQAYQGVLSPDALAQMQLPNIDDFEQKVEKVREVMKGIAVLVGVIAAGLLLWKIGDMVKDIMVYYSNVEQIQKLYKTFTGKDISRLLAIKKTENASQAVSLYKDIAGYAMIAAGALLLLKGYSDAWVNGIDWGNFAMILGGIALIVGGITLAFGTMAGAIALAIGGVAAIIIGIKDFATNGYSLQSVLLILGGAVAVLVGVLWAFNAALLANPITWIVVGVMALVAVFVILWNECEGFRNFWINLWEKVKAAFSKFVKTLEPLWESIKSAFKSAGEFIAVIWQGISGDAKKTWDNIKLIWNVVGPYFKMIWENIKVLFAFGAEFMGAKLKLAWETIKIVWNQVVSYFKAIFDSISAIFDIFTAAFKGDWQGVSDAVKRLVGTWAGFFQNTWNNIKKIFSAVGTYFSSVFSSAWEGIKRIFSNIGSYFKNWGNTVGDALGSAIKSAVNGVLSRAVKIINGFIGAINTAISVINAIPGVNIKTLNKLDVPKLATGGIISGATLAMVGERGREAVLPLENNTEWMDALAERIAARNNSPSRIVLQVGEKELGYAVINSINGITRQTGKLQLVY